MWVGDGEGLGQGIAKLAHDGRRDVFLHVFRWLKRWHCLDLFIYLCTVENMYLCRWTQIFTKWASGVCLVLYSAGHVKGVWGDISTSCQHLAHHEGAGQYIDLGIFSSLQKHGKDSKLHFSSFLL
jgi:hypothetical protein